MAARPRRPPGRDGTAGYARGAGVRIWYRSIGRGPPLLLLHGGPGADHTDFLPYLLPLARRFRLVLLDQRGSGHSTKPADPRDYRLECMVEDLEAVRRRLRIRAWCVLGHSFGGLLAQAYALAHPDRVRALALVGTASSARAIDADFRRILRRARPSDRRRMAALERSGIFTRTGEYKRAYAALTARILAPYMEPDPSRVHHEFPPIATDVVRALWSEHSDFRVGGTLSGFDFTAGLRDLALPVLIVIGARDLVSLATAEQTRAACRHASLIVIADAGHLMFIDATALFNALLESFLVRSAAPRR
jgi:proline iminopeptidase